MLRRLSGLQIRSPVWELNHCLIRIMIYHAFPLVKYDADPSIWLTMNIASVSNNQRRTVPLSSPLQSRYSRCTFFLSSWIHLVVVHFLLTMISTTAILDYVQWPSE